MCKKLVVVVEMDSLARKYCIYRPFHLAHCDEHMRNYLKNTDKKCRRDLLMNYFKEKPNKPNVKHDCCDVCLAACICCLCNALEKPSDVTPPNETVEMATVVRQVPEEDREFLYEMLKDIKINTESPTSVLGSAGLVFELGEQVIEAIVSKCEYVFSVSFIMDNFPIFSEEVANEILIIFDEIFNDIDEAEFLSSMDQSVIDDMSFLDVDEQASAQDEISRIRKWKRNVNTLNRCGNMTAITCFR